MSKKKKIIIGVIVAAVILIAAFAGIYAYQQDQQQRAITAATAKIDATSVSFNESQDRTEKLKILQDAQKLYAEDSLAKISADLNDKYSSVIADFQTFFINDYEAVIKNNTIALDTATKADLEKCKSNLAACLNNIASEGAIVIVTDGGKAYTDQINALITSYDAKIAEIIVAEEAAAKAEAERIAAEEAAKAEAERLAAEEEANKKNNNTSSNKNKSNSGSADSSNSGLGESSSGGSSSSTRGHGRYEEIWMIDENGNEMPGSRIRHYEDGWSEYLDGSGSFNRFDWDW